MIKARRYLLTEQFAQTVRSCHFQKHKNIKIGNVYVSMRGSFITTIWIGTSSKNGIIVGFYVYVFHVLCLLMMCFHQYLIMYYHSMIHLYQYLLNEVIDWCRMLEYHGFLKSCWNLVLFGQKKSSLRTPNLVILIEHDSLNLIA